MQCKKSKKTNQNPPKHQNFTSSPILCDFLKSNDLRKISGLAVTSLKGRIAGCGCYSYRIPLKYYIDWSSWGKSGPDVLRPLFPQGAQLTSKLTLPLRSPNLNSIKGLSIKAVPQKMER